ncbi:MAG: efflux RND transporter periplasmic adaptor subunit [Eubacteriales bacterium]|nr:efflux RND transporter periplasmic adaptor subunit [Eubacteriales bacterium]
MSETTKKNTGRNIWRSLLAACAVIFVIAVIFRIMKPEEPMDTKPLSTVSTAFPEVKDIDIETGLVGTILPSNMYYVIPKTQGEVIEIYVEQGQIVEKGAPICKIDNQKQIDSAKIQLDSAKVQLNTAREAYKTTLANYNRMSALLQTGDVSVQAFEQTKTGLEQAKAAVEGAELALQGAELNYNTQLEFSMPTAPAAGKVESETMELNQMVAPGNPICIISGEGAMEVQFSVTDRLLQSIKVGDKVRIEKQGSEYAGAITEIATVPGQQTGLYLVEASVEGDAVFTPGSNVNVYFRSGGAKSAVTVDTNAVYYDGGKNYVYTVEYNENAVEAAGSTIDENNKLAIVHKVEVQTGASDGKSTEITEGITKDDEIIVTWTAQLYEGANVQVLSEEE